MALSVGTRLVLTLVELVVIAVLVLRPRPVIRRAGRPEGAVLAMMAVYAAAARFLSVQRHRAFWTGRFDVGNMVQAVWSTAQGRPLETTDTLGRQFTRLGAHVDPILVLFTPLTWTGHLPEALLVSQAVIVATGAIPAFLLGRRWLGDDRLAVAAAAVYLLYPPLDVDDGGRVPPGDARRAAAAVVRVGGGGAAPRRP